MTLFFTFSKEKCNRFLCLMVPKWRLNASASLNGACINSSVIPLGRDSNSTFFAGSTNITCYYSNCGVILGVMSRKWEFEVGIISYSRQILLVSDSITSLKKATSCICDCLISEYLILGLTYSDSSSSSIEEETSSSSTDGWSVPSWLGPKAGGGTR